MDTPSKRTNTVQKRHMTPIPRRWQMRSQDATMIPIVRQSRIVGEVESHQSVYAKSLREKGLEEEVTFCVEVFINFDNVDSTQPFKTVMLALRHNYDFSFFYPSFCLTPVFS